MAATLADLRRQIKSEMLHRTKLLHQNFIHPTPTPAGVHVAISSVAPLDRLHTGRQGNLNSSPSLYSANVQRRRYTASSDRARFQG